MDGQNEVIDKQEEEEKQGQRKEQEEEEEQRQQQEGGSASQTIIKGKRTKRQRPQSPIPFRMITPPYPHNHNNSHNSSPTKSDHGSDICSSSSNNDNKYIEENSINFIKANNVDHHLTLSTATTITTSTTTTTINEEEDMANCLILLAQGKAREPIHIIPPQPRKPISTTVLQEHGQDGNNNVGAKFTSRKFMEVITAGKSGGYYVYECRTCSKTFSSFQALGGHRASHKKPRLTQPNTIRNNSSLFTYDDDPPSKMSSYSLSLQLTNRGLMMYGNGGGGANGNQHQSRPRVHECAVCGAEFSSGQALGGHMRRHRGAGITAAPPPLAAVSAEQQAELMKMPTNTTLSLDLDLNLPAPTEDVVDQNQQQHSQPKQLPATPSSPSTHQNNQQQPQQVVPSSLALVDCHY